MVYFKGRNAAGMKTLGSCNVVLGTSFEYSIIPSNAPPKRNKEIGNKKNNTRRYSEYGWINLVLWNAQTTLHNAILEDWARRDINSVSTGYMLLEARYRLESFQ